MSVIHGKLSSRGRNAFTLVELLAVIVILAIILVIAVPKVMSIIKDSKKSTFSNSVKLIASSAEQRYTENKALGNNDKITCESVAKLSSSDYKLCEITFEQEKARVTVIGDGKFDGLSVVYASKTNAEVQDGVPERLYTFDDVYQIVDNLTTRIEELESELKTNKSQISSIDNKVNNFTKLDNEENIFLQNYPIGSIYLSYDNINPKEKFGGSWEKLENRFLIGAGDKYKLGETGGEESHILTIDEMPIHTHSFTTSSTSKTLTGSAVFMAVVKSNVEGNNLSNIVTRADGIFGREVYENSAVSANPDGTTELKDVMRKLTIDATHTHSGTTESVGSGSEHNNMPPYIGVYMWKRIG